MNVSTKLKLNISFSVTNGVTTQKAVIIRLTAVQTSNPEWILNNYTVWNACNYKTCITKRAAYHTETFLAQKVQF